MVLLFDSTTRILPMRSRYRPLALTFVSAALLLLAPAVCSAQLLPPGDFRGKSLNHWGYDFSVWAVATGLGGQPLPDTVDGVRYLPANYGGGDFVADVSVPQGTPLVVAPFFVFGERYQDGSQDNPNDPIIDQVFAEAQIRTILNGNVLLDGSPNDYLDRKFGVTVLPSAIPYTAPRPNNGVAATFIAGGVTTIYDGLSVGRHTIRNEFKSPLLGQNTFATFTYNVTVVPEPSAACYLIGSLVGFAAVRRRRAASPSSMCRSQ